MKKIILSFCCSAIALSLLAMVPAYSQDITGAFTGTVTDSTGAAVPNATVTVTNVTTGVTVFTGNTDEQGLYLAPSLPAGVYNLSFEAASFKKTDVSGVTLQVNQRARIDATLEPGSISETVTVVGESLGQLETETSSQGTTITSSQIDNLPLPSRNVLNLLTLVGGVSSGGSGTGINGNQLSINGSRTLNNEITVDGLSVVGGGTGAVTRLPSTEALREFKVQTSAYSAEFGRTSGGYVNAIVDSGTNEFHGGVYEYFRNEKLNANNFFNNLRGIERPADRFNQFGGKLGGPVRLPKFGEGGRLLTSGERTFFFANYEGLRRAVPFASNQTVPDERFRSGDFSFTSTRIIDPLTRQQFPGNRIPDNRIDPAARRILSLLPLPNQSGNADSSNNRRTSNFVNPGSTRPSNDELTARVDHSSGEAGRTFGRFTYFSSSGTQQINLPGILNNAANAGTSKSYQIALGHTQTFSPSIVGEASFGFLRNLSRTDPATLGIDVSNALGIARSPTNVVPTINISGFTGLGNAATNVSADNNFQGGGSLSIVRGAQVIKLGTQIRRNQFNAADPGIDYAGVYNFSGRVTSANNTTGNPINSFADFLLGAITSANYDLPQPLTGRRNYNLAFYVQDDWKVRPNLTLNLGLRYEYESPIREVNDIGARFDPFSGRLLVAGQNASRSVDLKADPINFAPRIGLAYSVTDRTVVRAAFGTFYSQTFSNLGGIVRFPGYTGRESFLDFGNGTPQPFSLSQGVPLTAVQSLTDPSVILQGASAANPITPISTTQGKTDPLSYSLQWNFGVQQDVGKGVIVEAAYVGSRGLHLPLILPYNNIPLESALDAARTTSNTVRQNLRPYPYLARFNAYINEGSSIYHSLQLKGERRISQRLSFLSTYTFSKSIDDGSGIYNFSQPGGLDAGQFPHSRRDLDRSISAFDRTHTFTATGTFTTPGPRFLRGFQISPIFIARTGLPDTITQNTFNPAAVQQRPNLITPNQSIYAGSLTPEGQAIRYLLAPNDPNFPLAPSGPFFTGAGATRALLVPSLFGTLGRNTIREPGEVNLDIAVAKRIYLTERVNIQLRGEAFNVLNHTNFNGPNTGLNVQADPAAPTRARFEPNTFGLITSAKSARFLQLVFRFEF